MKSKTKIKKQLKKKRNSNLVETVYLANKNKAWKKVAQILSGSSKKMVKINLEKINKNAKDKETIVVPGKVLSVGEIDKNITLIAFGFSEKTKEKLTKTKTSFSYIMDEIKKNPKAKEVKILK